ncbi:MAG: DUF58 domain-containing protein [Microcoleaceae cyanobacterium]
MKFFNRITNWLETRGVVPSYAGGLLCFLAVFFFGAATNTMAGWLYVISGISLALLLIAAILPLRSLRDIQVRRYPIQPVSAGDQLSVELDIRNSTTQPKTLIQVQDQLPSSLGKAATVIETLSSQAVHRWVYYLPTQKRGVYPLHQVRLRTGTPLGLFWCSRSRVANGTAVVYPQVFPLSTCPLVDNIGQEYSPQIEDRNRFQLATEGVTRTLRPYRHGDPSRLIHWRSSARYGELRVRELEHSTGGQEIIICLDSAAAWQADDFEQAVTVAASLYFYCCRCQLNVQLWTAKTGVVQGHHVVLSTLAAVQASVAAQTEVPPFLPLIWLTQNSTSLTTLPPGSRWIFWTEASDSKQTTVSTLPYPGLRIDSTQPLPPQLQSTLEG